MVLKTYFLVPRERKMSTLNFCYLVTPNHGVCIDCNNHAVVPG